jgi:hypothetical protein
MQCDIGGLTRIVSNDSAVGKRNRSSILTEPSYFALAALGFRQSLGEVAAAIYCGGLRRRETLS